MGANVENVRIMSSGAANVAGNGLNNLFYAGAGNNYLGGGAGIDTVTYTQGATAGVTVSLAITNAQATGGSGSDTLSSIENLIGSNYGDTLTGNTGANTLAGGLGQDILTGGSGADLFDFNVITETGNTGGTADTITDFVSGLDKIDLSTIDAIAATGSNDAFSYIGTAAFSGDASGKLRFDSTAKILYGSTDADTDAEFAINLTGLASLAGSDLLL